MSSLIRQVDASWLLGAQLRLSAGELGSLCWLSFSVLFHVSFPCAYLELSQTCRSQGNQTSYIVADFQQHKSKNCQAILRLRSRTVTASFCFFLLFKTRYKPKFMQRKLLPRGMIHSGPKKLTVCHNKIQFPLFQENYRMVVLKVWSPDQQHQHNWEIFAKHKFLGCTSDIMSQNFWA